ncbi:MAG: hypothetical protein IPK15_09205 [Verrucomicrobia bacterium]|nr:hypothetical protein [Verrucomicrobiota bacterium]
MGHTAAIPAQLHFGWQAANPGRSCRPVAVDTNGETIVPDEALHDIIAVDTCRAFTLALTSAGSVVSWGADAPVPLAAHSGVRAIAAGHSHVLALKADGTVVAWGTRNNAAETNVPADLRDVVRISAGGNRSIAVKGDGTAVQWGFGINGYTNLLPSLSNIQSVETSGLHDVVLLNDGTVIAYGYGFSGSSAVTGLTNVTAVAAGFQFSLAPATGTVFAPGKRANTLTNIASGLSNVIAISAGNSFCLALKSDGYVVAWGNGPSSSTNAPNELAGVVAIGAGYDHSAAIYTSALPEIIQQPTSLDLPEWQPATFSVKAKGFPLSYKWTKDGIAIPGATNSAYAIAAVRPTDAGEFRVEVSSPFGDVVTERARLSIKPPLPGRVVAWGSFNTYGLTNVPPEARGGVVAVAPGFNHVLALKEDGTVIGWGSNSFGETSIPLGLRDIVAIAAGPYSSLALRRNGSLVGWGRERGTNIPTGLSNVQAIAAGNGHFIALKSDGTVAAWGNNSGAPFPPGGTGGQATVPSGLTGVNRIAAGGYHSVALRSNGTVVTWGNNYFGATNTPAGLTDVIEIAAGEVYTLALRREGGVVGWGSSLSGIPAQAPSGVVAIAVGGAQPMALLQNGNVISWTSSTNIFTPAVPDLNNVVSIAGRDQVYYAIVGIGLRSEMLPDSSDYLIKWPASARGFVLQSTTDLSPPTVWMNSTTAPTFTGTHWAVTNVTSNEKQFFRLVEPFD